MLDVARALDAQPPPAGNRVAIITNSGGTGVELADLLNEEGLAVPELTAELQERIRALLPRFASPANPIDITPTWERFAELYPRLVDMLARCGEVDVVIPVLVQRAAMDAAVVQGLRETVVQLRRQSVDVPVYVCWVAPRSGRANAGLLQEAGLPCFEWPERTARAAGHAARFGATRGWQRSASPGGPPRARLMRLPTGQLDVDLAATLLRHAGIPTVESITCTTVADAVRAAERIGYPVVCKVVHPEVVHRSDRGGVVLNLRDHDGVRAAARALLQLADGARVQVQAQLDGVEVVVGGLRDPQFGPVIMIGLGGSSWR
jgi:acetyltransferase